MATILPADFHELVGVDDPDVDPAGERVAFVRRVPKDDEAYEATVYVADIETSDVTRMTVTEGSDAQPRWRPDGGEIAFVSDRLTDDERPQIWLLPVGGGEASQVTNVAGGVSALAWSPDGGRLLFSQHVNEADVEDERDLEVPEDYEPEEPDPRVIDRTIYRAHTRYFDRKRERLYVLDLETEEVDRLDDWAEEDQRMSVWGDDSTVYYVTSVGDDPDDSLEQEIRAVDVETGETKVVTAVEGFVSGFDATPAGTLALAMAEVPRPTLTQSDLYRIEADTGVRRVLTESVDRAVLGPIRFDDDGDRIFFLTPDSGAYVLRSTDLEGSEHPVITDESATTSTYAIGGDRVAYVQSAWDHPGDLFARRLDGGERTRLTEVNGELLADRDVQRPEEFWVESPEGHEIQGWLLWPPDDAPSEPPYPLVLEIHGGPHSMYTTSGTMWHELQSIAGAGYAVLWTNPRGSIGYGEAFAAAIERDWGDVTHADLMHALDTVVERETIDETQLFVTGGSFGGYQTAWTIGRTDRFEAAASQRGLYDIPAFFGTSDAYRLIESEFQATPWEDQAYLYGRSPTSLVEAVDTPTLVIHSEADFRTPIATAEMYFNALRKLEVPTRLVRYPREGHELSRSGEPAHRVDRIERIIRWFDGYASHTEVPPALERPPNDGLSIDQEPED